MTENEAAKRGDELCADCKTEWRKHYGKEQRCDKYDARHTFQPSGRVAPPEPGTTNVHNYPPPRPVPPRQSSLDPNPFRVNA